MISAPWYLHLTGSRFERRSRMFSMDSSLMVMDMCLSAKAPALRVISVWYLWERFSSMSFSFTLSKTSLCSNHLQQFDAFTEVTSVLPSDQVYFWFGLRMTDSLLPWSETCTEPERRMTSALFKEG